MPDGIADFSTIKLEEVGINRVKVSNMSGKKRPDTLKLCIGYRDGYIGEGMVLFPAPDALEKARFAEKWLRERFKLLGVEFEELRIDYIGVNTLHGEAAEIKDIDYNEVGLRVAGKAKTRKAAETVRREATHLWTQGPIGSSFGTPLNVRPVIKLWPTLVPRDAVRTESQLMEVK